MILQKMQWASRATVSVDGSIFDITCRNVSKKLLSLEVYGKKVTLVGAETTMILKGDYR